MVELTPDLADRVQVFQDRVYLPDTDSILAPLPAEAHRLQGLDPTLVIVDELASVQADVYDAVALAAGKRDRSLTLAISTPATDKDGPMWALVEHGREETDPAFYFREYAAPDGCEVDDEEAWAVANPALDDFLSRDAMRATLRTSRESVFRQFRLGQWVGAVGSWLEWGAWEARADRERVVEDGERVVLGFDGSASGDSTALVGCTLDGHVFLVGLWENDRDPRWRVDRHEVEGAIEAAVERYDVVELAADPWGWRSELEAWSARWPGRVLEWPTNIASRMAPATDRLYQAVTAGTVTNDGDARLAAHVRNCVAKRTPLGDLVAKDRRESPRKIDAAVAAIVSYDRAAYWAAHPPRRARVASF
jgi:phage terminase large subunit-like protein